MESLIRTTLPLPDVPNYTANHLTAATVQSQQ